MGKIKTKCPKCGTENINDMLVEFLWDDSISDTTTLPKFLHYLRYPIDRQRGFYEPNNSTSHGIITKIKRIYCGKPKCGAEIKPTRYGI